MEFFKFHGTGNDFIMVDNRDGLASLDEGTVKDLCHRRFGIGADGLILLQKDPDHDMRMIYYNSDGKESTMCGNGGRCLAAFANYLGMIDSEGTFNAIDGIHAFSVLNRTSDVWQVKLGMNEVTIASGDQTGDLIVDTGSPHFVRLVDDPAKIDIIQKAKEIRYSQRFKDDGINVNFISEGEHGITIRTYERGVENETLSCGTGCVAAAIATGRGMADGHHEVIISTQGGKVKVTFTKTGTEYKDVFLTGPAEMVFKGKRE